MADLLDEQWPDVTVGPLQEPHAAQAPHEYHGLRQAGHEGRARSVSILCRPARLHREKNAVQQGSAGFKSGVHCAIGDQLH